MIVLVNDRFSRILARQLRGGKLLATGPHQLPEQVRTAVGEKAEASSRVVVGTNNLQRRLTVIEALIDPGRPGRRST